MEVWFLMLCSPLITWVVQHAGTILTLLLQQTYRPLFPFRKLLRRFHQQFNKKPFPPNGERGKRVKPVPARDHRIPSPNQLR